MTGHSPLAEPPEGVTAGESVPRENEADDRRAAALAEVKATLKTRGEPYRSMSESELTERARRLMEN